jgi:hypothetical protein
MLIIKSQTKTLIKIVTAENWLENNFKYKVNNNVSADNNFCRIVNGQNIK